MNCLRKPVSRWIVQGGDHGVFHGGRGGRFGRVSENGESFLHCAVRRRFEEARESDGKGVLQRWMY